MSLPRVLAIAAVVTLCAKTAAAEASEMGQAVADFEAAEQALATSPPCETMCKALQSMSNAAARICELAKDGSPLDQKRCVDAKTKVEEATARVRASCPDCVTAKPDTGVTATKPTTVPPPPPSPGKTETEAKEPVAMTADHGEAAAMSVGGGRRSSLMLDLLPLFLPPTVVQPRWVQRIGPHTALAIAFGYGSVPKTDGRENGRTAALMVGGELRVNVAGRFDRGVGLFVGADFAYRNADLEFGERVTARSFPLGFALGPEVGLRAVCPYGFTVEARAGVDFLAQDLRGPGSPTDRVLPLGAISLGWTF